MSRKKKYNVILQDDDVKKLKAIIPKGSSPKTVKCRCQILLDLDDTHGKPYTHEQAAKSNGVCIATVTNIVKQYIEEAQTRYWPDIAEIELNVMTRQCLFRRIDDIGRLARIQRYGRLKGVLLRQRSTGSSVHQMLGSSYNHYIRHFQMLPNRRHPEC